MGVKASLADSRIECLRDRSAILNLLTVRIVALEYSQQGLERLSL